VSCKQGEVETMGAGVADTHYIVAHINALTKGKSAKQPLFERKIKVCENEMNQAVV
jgi:hypothetical protein